MKVFQIENDWSFEHLTLKERPIPKPGPGEVLLRMKAASLNFRDLVVLRRGYGSLTGTLPLVPVSDGVGEVTEVGAGVTRVNVGDRVCPLFMQRWISGPPNRERLTATLGGPLDGVMAEWMALPAEAVCMAPEHLSDEECAALPCAALTAWSALITEGRLKPGDSVLVQGTGGVSLFALLFAKMAGAKVVIISGNEDKLARALKLGADEGLNYRDIPEWGREVRELCEGEGVDQIVEVGGSQTFPQSLHAVRPGGTISMIGVLSGPTMEAQLGLIVTRQIRMQGITVGNRDGFEAMTHAITLHNLRPVIDRTYDFEQLPDALNRLRSGAHFGKICLRFN